MEREEAGSGSHSSRTEGSVKGGITASSETGEDDGVLEAQYQDAPSEQEKCTTSTDIPNRVDDNATTGAHEESDHGEDSEDSLEQVGGPSTPIQENISLVDSNCKTNDSIKGTSTGPSDQEGRQAVSTWNSDRQQTIVDPVKSEASTIGKEKECEKNLKKNTEMITEIRNMVQSVQSDVTPRKNSLKDSRPVMPTASEIEGELASDNGRKDVQPLEVDAQATREGCCKASAASSEDLSISSSVFTSESQSEASGTQEDPISVLTSAAQKESSVILKNLSTASASTVQVQESSVKSMMPDSTTQDESSVIQKDAITVSASTVQVQEESSGTSTVPASTTQEESSVVQKDARTAPASTTQEESSVVQKDARTAPASTTQEESSVVQKDASTVPASTTQEESSVVQKDASTVPASTTQEESSVVQKDASTVPASTTQEESSVVQKDASTVPASTTQEESIVVQKDASMAPASTTQEESSVVQKDASTVPASTTQEESSVVQKDASTVPASTTQEESSVVQKDARTAPASTTQEESSVVQKDASTAPASTTQEESSVVQKDASMAPASTTQEESSVVQKDASTAPASTTQEESSVVQKDASMAPASTTQEESSVVQKDASTVPTSTVQEGSSFIPETSRMASNSGVLMDVGIRSDPPSTAPTPEAEVESSVIPEASKMLLNSEVQEVSLRAAAPSKICEVEEQISSSLEAPSLDSTLEAQKDMGMSPEKIATRAEAPEALQRKASQIEEKACDFLWSPSQLPETTVFKCEGGPQARNEGKTSVPEGDVREIGWLQSSTEAFRYEEKLAEKDEIIAELDKKAKDMEDCWRVKFEELQQSHKAFEKEHQRLCNELRRDLRSANREKDVNAKLVSELRDQLDQLNRDYGTLQNQMSQYEQQHANEQSRGGSYLDDTKAATPALLVSAVNGVKDSSNNFVKVLKSSLQSGISLDSVIGPVSRTGHIKFQYQAYICRILFSDFHLPHGGSSRVMMPPTKFFHQYQMHDLKKTDTVEKLLQNDPNIDASLREFCLHKFSILLERLPEPLIDNSIDLKQQVQRKQHPRDSKLYVSFCKVAVSVWLLQRLAFSFLRPAKKFIARSGEPYDTNRMQSVVPLDEPAANEEVQLKVGFYVLPGFDIGNSAIPCEVYVAL